MSGVSRVFIGSSTGALHVANEVGEALKHCASVTIWPEAFRPGQMLLTSILGLVRQFDFGVFVLAPDDLIQVAGKQTASTRDNVIFEAGVFMGVLGTERTFLLAPTDFRETIHLPSDLQGLLLGTYPGAGRRARKDRLKAKHILSIEWAIQHLGPAPRSAFDEMLVLKRSLEARDVSGAPRVSSLLDVVKYAAKERPRAWFMETDPVMLIEPIKRRFGDDAADNAYWWAIVCGVLRFQDIQQFTEGSWHWSDSIPFSQFSERGIFLLNELRREEGGAGREGERTGVRGRSKRAT